MIKRVILAACIFSSAITVNSHLVSAEKESSRAASTEVGKDHELSRRDLDSDKLTTNEPHKIKPEKPGVNANDKQMKRSGNSAV